MKPFRFKVKLGGAGKYGKVAFFTPPFEMKKTFGTTGRVPVKGMINGFPFRNSLCQMGGPHFMCVNKQLCAGAKCGVGDTVSVVLERDDKKRVMPVPAFLRKAISSDEAARANWKKRSFTYQKEQRAVGYVGKAGRKARATDQETDAAAEERKKEVTATL